MVLVAIAMRPNGALARIESLPCQTLTHEPVSEMDALLCLLMIGLTLAALRL
jgi:hypothetical protein